MKKVMNSNNYLQQHIGALVASIFVAFFVYGSSTISYAAEESWIATESTLVRQQEWNGAFFQRYAVQERYIPKFDIGAPVAIKQASLSDDGSVIALEGNTRAIYPGDPGSDERTRSVFTPALFVSVDGGASWAERSYSAGYGNAKSLISPSVSGDGKKIFAIQPIHRASGNNYRHDYQIVVSTNGGESWTSLGGFPFLTGFETGREAYHDPQDGNVTIHPVSKDGSKVIIIASPSGSGSAPGQNPYNVSVWMSHNGGTSWARTLDIPSKTTIPWREVNYTKPAHSQDGSVIVLPSANARTIYYSTDSGVTWKTHTFDDASIPTFSISVSDDGKNIFVGGLYNRWGEDRVFISKDSGATWSVEEASKARAIVGAHAAIIDGNSHKIFFSVNGAAHENVDLTVDPRTISYDSKVTVSRDGSTLVLTLGPDSRYNYHYTRDLNKIYIYSASSEKLAILRAPQGTLSVTPAGPCTVATNQTCKVTVTWSTQKTKGSVVQAAGPLWPAGANVTAVSTNSSGSANFDLPAGTYVFAVAGYDGTKWIPSLGSVRYDVVVYTASLVVPIASTTSTSTLTRVRGSISVSPGNTCTLSVGAQTCRVTIMWNTQNAQQSVVQGAGPLWPNGANMMGPTSGASESFYRDLPPGDYIFSVSGFDGRSWSAPLASVTYRVTPAPVSQPQPTTTPVTTTPSTQTPTVQTNVHAPDGYFDALTCNFISGWAADKDVPERSVNVQLWDTVTTNTGSISSLLGVYTTDKTRADVNRALGITGSHGFSIPVPERLKDGKEHRINVWAVDPVSGIRTHLRQSPRAVTCAPVVGLHKQTTATLLASTLMTPGALLLDTLVSIFVQLGVVR